MNFFYIHNFYYIFFNIFYLFIFLFFIFGLGWAKSSLAYILVAGLSSAPQGLGQPGPVTCPSHWPAGQTADAPVKHFHVCINSAKVIKLPSHCSNAIWTQKSKNKWKRACLFLEIAKKAATLVGFDCFPFLAMVKKAAIRVWVRMLSVNNRWFGDQFFSCRDENRADPWLPSAFLSFLCIYFLVYALFFFGFLLCFGLMFPFLTLYFFWLCLVCSVFLGWLLCFSGLLLPLVLGFLFPFIETHSLPLVSPAFAGLYLPRTRSWARDVVHYWICCRFSGLRLNRDEEDHTVLPPATATFRPKDTFSLWPLNFGNLAIGPLSN